MKKKSFLVGLDRDDTLTYDDPGGYFGKDPGWENRIVFYPTVIEGLKLLKQEPRIKIVVATNQAGVAKGWLTEQRVQEVN